jgi:ribosomal protein S18 acetylase RimI-like enzyme
VTRAERVRVRERRASDTRAVRAVARATWRATYERLVPARFIRAVLRGGYDRRRLAEGLLQARRDAFVAQCGDEVVGYADVIEEPPGRVELTRIYVRPDRQGTGVGAALLHACVAAARRRRAVALEVGVEPANERAIAWYRRRGFLPNGTSSLVVGSQSRPLSRLSLPLPV